jgi:hypothetical protein
MKMKLTIQNRKVQGNSDLHVVNNHDEKAIYCHEILIGSNANGYTLMTSNEEVELKDQDRLLTPEHIINIDINTAEKQHIQYNESRAPSQNLSQSWENIGLEVLQPNASNISDSILPTNYSQHEPDPLDFLVNNNRHRDDRLSLEMDNITSNSSHQQSEATTISTLIPNPLANESQSRIQSIPQITHYPTTEYENNLLLNKHTTYSNKKETDNPLKKMGSLLSRISR